MPEESNSHVTAGRNMTVSLVTPAFNEERNLPHLYDQIREVLRNAGFDWEWIVVDDCSRDGTYDVIMGLCAQDPRVRGIRLSRNVGSHCAIVCGIEHAVGDCAIALAADLQDRPDMIPEMIAEWKKGTQVVWAVRAGREGESLFSTLAARCYYGLMRNVVGLKDLPAKGSDYFLLDRRVMNALKSYGERNISLMALILWMGFVQKEILYTKQARVHGHSGWTFSKKLKLVADSVISFSYLPLRIMSGFGFLVAMSGFVYAIYVIINAILGKPQAGWSSLMVAVLVIGGVLMAMMGILGEYLWRTLDEVRGRPRYMISNSVNLPNNHGKEDEV